MIRRDRRGRGSRIYSKTSDNRRLFSKIRGANPTIDSRNPARSPVLGMPPPVPEVTNGNFAGPIYPRNSALLLKVEERTPPSRKDLASSPPFLTTQNGAATARVKVFRLCGPLTGGLPSRSLSLRDHFFCWRRRTRANAPSNPAPKSDIVDASGTAPGCGSGIVEPPNFERNPSASGVYE